MKKKKYVMEVTREGGGSTWEEEIGKESMWVEGKVVDDKTAVKMAKDLVSMFNESRREGEEERELVNVFIVTSENIFEGGSDGG